MIGCQFVLTLRIVYSMIVSTRRCSGPTGCALAAPPPIDGCHIVTETGAEKRTISHDAKRRPLQARVGRLCFVFYSSLARTLA